MEAYAMNDESETIKPLTHGFLDVATFLRKRRQP
jgi:hypothetical protein